MKWLIALVAILIVLVIGLRNLALSGSTRIGQGLAHVGGTCGVCARNVRVGTTTVVAPTRLIIVRRLSHTMSTATARKNQVS